MRISTDSSRAIEAIDALVSGYTAARRARALFVMLQVFVDDSYDAESRVFVLAGYAASVDQWKAFTAQWDHILIGQKLPYFKMSESNQWGEERLSSILPYLQNVICDNVQFGVQVVVDKEMLLSEFDGFLGKKIANPYYFSFFRLLTKILMREDLPGGNHDKIEFIFDEQIHEKKYIREVWEEFKSILPEQALSRLGGEPIFRSDKDVLPLQAADFRAWQVRNQWASRVLGRPQYRVPLLPNKRTTVLSTMWDGIRLKELKADFLRDIGAHGPVQDTTEDTVILRLKDFMFGPTKTQR